MENRTITDRFNESLNGTQGAPREPFDIMRQQASNQSEATDVFRMSSDISYTVEAQDAPTSVPIPPVFLNKGEKVTITIKREAISKLPTYEHNVPISEAQVFTYNEDENERRKPEERNPVLARLEQTRKNFEQTGILIGLGATILLCIGALCGLLSWPSIVPAAVMFMTMVGFVLIRKRLRGRGNL